MKYGLIAVVYFLMAGCSTVYTLNNAEEGVVMKGSYCNDINYVFSGVGYNWCKLNGTPNSNPDPKSSEGDFHYVGIDSLFSFVSDVLVLPYTIYKQVSAEPIKVRSEKKLR